MNISRNSLIVLIIIVLVGGAGTAYAGFGLPTITLAGNVDIIGEMTCTDCVDSPEIEDGAITLQDLGQNGCSPDQIMRWDGSQWVCNNIVVIDTPPSITIVDSTDDVGEYTSIAIGNDGFPVISYHDNTNFNLKVAKCVNAACTGTSTITTVDSAGAVGDFTSIAIGNDGFPVISYSDGANGDLKVAKCVNAACTGTSTLTAVDSPDSVGRYTSIAIGNDGFPVISYYDSTNSNLNVAKCVNAACTGTSTITTVDSAGVGIVGRFTSIAIGNDGFPVISYHDNTNVDLKVAKCINVACTGTSTLTAVDSTDSVGAYTSIAIGNDGFPVISYKDGTNGGLKVAKCVNVSCTGTSTITTVDSTELAGTHTSIAIGNDGLPVISYHEGNIGLNVAKCVNVSCTGTSTITTVDSNGFSARYTSIAIGNDGLPVISYERIANFDLKVFKEEGFTIGFN